MKVKIKKVDLSAIIPSYSNPGDAGMDLTSVGFNFNEQLGYIEHRTGLAMEIPEGYVGLIFPRSSISKTSLRLCNSVGAIDSSYRGEITCRFKIDDNNDNTYYAGDRIAQMIIIPYPKIEFEAVEELSDTKRGEGGYGSSGK